MFMHKVKTEYLKKTNCVCDLLVTTLRAFFPAYLQCITIFKGVSIKRMAYIRSVLALKCTVGAATVKHFRPRLCPAGASLDKGVPRTWDATHQKE